MRLFYSGLGFPKEEITIGRVGCLSERRGGGETHNNISHKITPKSQMYNTHICMTHAFRSTIRRRRRSYLEKLVVCQKESSENKQNFPPIERNDSVDNQYLDKDRMVFFYQNR